MDSSNPHKGRINIYIFFKLASVYYFDIIKYMKKRKGQTFIITVIIIAIISAVFARSIATTLSYRGLEQLISFEQEQALYLAEMGVNEITLQLNEGIQPIPPISVNCSLPGYDCGWKIESITQKPIPPPPPYTYEYTITSTGRIKPIESDNNYIERKIKATVSGSVYEVYKCTLLSED